MKTYPDAPVRPRQWPGYRILIICLSAILLISLASCDALSGLLPAEEDPALKETEMELNVRQTLMAQKATESGIDATLEAQQAILDAQSAQATRIAQQKNQPTITPTADTALAVQQTVQAQQATQSAGQPTPADQPATPAAAPTSSQDLASWMKTANILLYEDMVGQLDTNRYVKDILDEMGLTYKDDGSAKGWLKSDMLSGAPNGKPWDLVIIAAEAKIGVQGEFFTYVVDALDQGASVILETWYLDQTAQGTAAELLSRCGVAFEKNWAGVPPERAVMFVQDSTDPIMQEPNSGLGFTKVTGYWWNLSTDYDTGDWMKIVSGGDAKILVNTMASETKTHGTVIVCNNRQLILQTFSSHQLTYNSMKLVWENYIYNMLKTRFESLN